MNRRARILVLVVLVVVAGAVAALRWDGRGGSGDLAARYDCPPGLSGPLVGGSDVGLATDSFLLSEVAQIPDATSISIAADGIAFITTRTGMVHRLLRDQTSELVLDLTAEVSTSSLEQGLLGSALSPDESVLYLDYTDSEGDTKVVATSIEQAGRLDEPQLVLEVEQPHHWHNAGGLAVDEDGNLFVTLGDGGGQADPWENGQDRSTPLGSILRITPTPGQGVGHTVPADNPFVDEPDADPRIWAYGLRNPFRVARDRQDLWISDAGDGCYEEIDWLRDADAGANFGWDHVEGPWAVDDEPADHRAPVFTYTRTDGACAVIGGFVYRGAALPGLEGTYLFADHCRGELIALDLVNGEGVATALGVAAPTVTGFAAGPDGEPWIITLEGTVYRLEPASS